MSLDDVAAQAAQAVAALGGLTRVPRIHHATITSLSPLQITYRGESAAFDVAHSYVAKPVLDAECAVYAEGSDRWLLAQRTTATAVSTMSAVAFSPTFDDTGFSAQDYVNLDYTEAVQSALVTKINAIRAALLAAGIVS